MSHTQRLRGIALADIHAPIRENYGVWSHIPELKFDTYRALNNICRYAATHSINIWIAGDIFDGSRPNSWAVKKFVESISPILNSNASIFYIIGNHDNGEDWLSIISTIHSDKIINVNNISNSSIDYDIGGLSYQSNWPPSAWPWSDATVPGIGLYHQNWKEFSRFGTANIDVIPYHACGAVLGDVHSRKYYQYPDHKKPLYVSPGPLVPQGVDEINDYKSTILALTEQNSWVELDLGLRSYHQVYHGSDLDVTLNSLTQFNSGSAVIIRGCPADAIAEEAIKIQALRQNIVPVFRPDVIRQSEKLLTSAVIKLQSNSNSKNLLLDTLKQDKTLDDSDVGLIAKLLDAADPVTVLETERELFLRK